MNKKSVLCFFIAFICVLCVACTSTEDVQSDSHNEMHSEIDGSNENEQTDIGLLYFADTDHTDRLGTFLQHYNAALEQYGIVELDASIFVPTGDIVTVYNAELDSGIKIYADLPGEVIRISSQSENWEAIKPYITALIDCTSPQAEQVKESLIPDGDIKDLEGPLHWEDYRNSPESPDAWTYTLHYSKNSNRVTLSAEQMVIQSTKPEAYS